MDHSSILERVVKSIINKTIKMLIYKIQKQQTTRMFLTLNKLKLRAHSNRMLKMRIRHKMMDGETIHYIIMDHRIL
jgi:hypothetical protein